MGEIASRVADHTMITDDNPRSESSSVITGEILKGAAVKKDVQVVTDRRSAILKVLGEASNKDTVLIAGKGHEEYQEINGKKYSFSDYKVVEDFVSQMR